MTLWITALCLVALSWWMFWRFRIQPQWIADAPRIEDSIPRPEGRISVIIPARNEARELPRLLQDLLGQGPADLEIIVVDDHSIDGTTAYVREAARNDSRIRLVRAAPKPAAWAGKNWAVDQGVKKAAGDWLLFCDADVRVRPGTLDQAMSLVAHESLDALSLVAGMHSPGRGAVLLLACFALSRALLFPCAAPGRRGLVQGAFLVVRRAAYAAVGGHERDKSALLEDVELGYRLQTAGFRVRTYPARHWITAHMYETLGETQEGFQKHMFPAMKFSRVRVAAIAVLHVVLFLFPLLSLLLSFRALLHDGITGPELGLAGASLLAMAAMVSVCVRLVRAEALPVFSAVAAPVSYFWMGAALSASVSGYREGAIAWKGRHYGTRHDNNVELN